MRDGTGLDHPRLCGPIGYIPNVPTRNILYGIGAVDLRASALQAESLIDQAALDRYTFIRRAYLQRREYLVYDGKPPPPKDDDDDRRSTAAIRHLRSIARARRSRCCCSRARPPALAQEAPDALVKRVSQEVLQIIKSDPKVQAGDQARIREVIETKLAPNFDFERMTALAMGRNWRTATPEQQKQLVDAVPHAARAHVFGRARRSIATRRSTTSRCAPIPTATEVIVRTEVVRPGQPPVQIDYSMDKTPATAGRPTTSSSAACRSSPTTATSSRAGAGRRHRRPHQDADREERRRRREVSCMRRVARVPAPTGGFVATDDAAGRSRARSRSTTPPIVIDGVAALPLPPSGMRRLRGARRTPIRRRSP